MAKFQKLEERSDLQIKTFAKNTTRWPTDA